MKEIRINGCRLGSDIKETQKGGYVNVAVSKWGQLPDGTYGNKTMWATVYLTDSQVKYCKEKDIKKGTAVCVLGRFDYGMNEKDGKNYLFIAINPYYIVKAPGGLGGICLTTIDNVRLTEDIVTNDNGTGRVRVAFDTFVGGKTETRWATMMLNESMMKRAQGLKLKKGSHIDLGGEINIEQHSYNGKDYVNATINVGNFSYAANSGRQNAADTTAENTAPEAPAASEKPAATSEAPAAPTAPAQPTETPADDFFTMDESEDPFQW